MLKKKNIPLSLMLFAVLLTAIWSAIKPYSRGIWTVEISSAVVVFALLAVTFHKFRFSNAAYFIVFLWFELHCLGAHYSYELVPFESIGGLFGFERNNFDRLAHFVVGMNAYGAAEYLWRSGKVNSIKTAAVVGVLFIMALANAWELIEYAYAEIDGGEVGAAFLGSQGDVWDAQKDMLCDTLGAIFAAALFLLFTPKYPKIIT